MESGFLPVILLAWLMIWESFDLFLTETERHQDVMLNARTDSALLSFLTRNTRFCCLLIDGVSVQLPV